MPHAGPMDWDLNAPFAPGFTGDLCDTSLSKLTALTTFDYMKVTNYKVEITMNSEFVFG